MYWTHFLVALAVAVATISAESPASYSGYSLVWQDTFAGDSGQSVNTAEWNLITDIRVNNEWQTYTTSARNHQISGGGTLQIIPLRDSNGAWTSARVESVYTFSPAPGRITMAAAKIRFGDHPIGNKRGLWPAFWMLGDSIREGVSWPATGEVDVLETVNGELKGYGTLHCDVYPRGLCNEGQGIGASVEIPNQGWHVWRVVWDRRPGVWADEVMTWYRDGHSFHSVSGAKIGSEAVWRTLCGSPLFFVLNMAVGGDWPGPPNGDTLDGWGSMMEVAYVAHYVS